LQAAFADINIHKSRSVYYWFGAKMKEVFVTSTDLFEIERSLWNNDPVLYHDTLHSDALLLFRETGVITRDVAVAAIRELNRLNHYWAEVEFADKEFLPRQMTRESWSTGRPRAGTMSRIQSLSYAAASTPCTPANGNLFSINKHRLPPDHR
jgi:hypothetical protein